MKKKITKRNNRGIIQYTIDTENKKITCYVEEYIDVAFRKLDARLDRKETKLPALSSFIQNNRDCVFYGYGTAICQEGDNFDEATGMTIAKKQAMRMVYEAKLQTIDNLLRDTETIRNTICDFKLQLKRAFHHNKG